MTWWLASLDGLRPDPSKRQNENSPSRRMNYPDPPETLQQLEELVLRQWREEDLFLRTLDATRNGKPFVFYEGPPTANGEPGLHHIISRTIKDLVCRHRTMLGHEVTRIAGWDTHGLPVEIEAEKKLGISGKPGIEAFGIDRFNETCRDSVFTYKEEWEELSERIGYWLDYSRPYVTFHADYIESVWWILARLAERGLLYRGFKSVPYCPRCGTALSSHEVAQGYREVQDPSLTFMVRLLDADGAADSEGRQLLVWTTTPWTVPANVALAVDPDLVYAEVVADGGWFVVAESRVEVLFGADATVVARYPGSELAGRRYARALDLVPEPAETANAWTVVAEDFVSAEEGTGIVHLAPAFGSDDYQAGKRHGLPMLRPVDDAGRFLVDIPLVGGEFVKDADPILVDALRERGGLFDSSLVTHSYPHCWRCESPLLYMARDSWFAATSTLREQLIANNAAVQWHPPEVGENRFGEWLSGNVDWALSRDRFWGTPMPVWMCDLRPDEHVEWIGSFAELRERAGTLPEDFDPHRPGIDEITWRCTSCDGVMRRAPEVIDVWFDSGAMPYAQWHYPFEHGADFERHFPADFICEGLDQTRGWFYSLLAISTMLGMGPAYRNVVVNDLILDAEGQKMSKSKGNAVNPWDAIEDHGADALRWYLVTSSNPWVPKRYDPEGVAESYRKFFDTLLNTYRFFALYARLEDWTPSQTDPPPSERPVLDRWLASRMAEVTRRIRTELDDYQITRAYRLLGEFLTDDLSNWYVRRSRPRFWGNSDPKDAAAAFRTLWEALRCVALLVAPLTPFVADFVHRALTGNSVHLQSFPEVIEADLLAALEDDMDAARTIVSLGRAAREQARIRVRQPLRHLSAVLPDRRALPPEVLQLVRDELNVKEVTFEPSADGLVSLAARPNFRVLGPRFQHRTEEAASAIRGLAAEALAAFRDGGALTIEVDGADHTLGPEELEVVEEATGGLVVKRDGAALVALDPHIDEDLHAEGLARELVSRIQRLRKDAGLHVSDRISLGIGGHEDVERSARAWRQLIAGETLAEAFHIGLPLPAGGFEAFQELELDGLQSVIGLSKRG